MSTDPFVIVGAGHAARRTAEALRARDADARIVMIGAERELPYDRPALSKDALLSDGGEQRAFVRDAAWYDAQRVELRLGTRVEAIERDARRVRLDDGATLPYARLVLATGSRVRAFGGPVDAGVVPHYVRTVADARALRAQLAPGRRVAVLGGGFIGLEVAAAARQRGCDVTVIDPAPRLLQRALPEVVGAYARQLHDAHGVNFQMATLPRAIRRAAGGGAIVETDRGDVPADIVVVGIGVVPNVELAQAAGLEVDNGIRVDAGCRTADHAIFAAGEVTMHFNPLLGRHVRIESWQVAETSRPSRPRTCSARTKPMPSCRGCGPISTTATCRCSVCSAANARPSCAAIRRAGRSRCSDWATMAGSSRWPRRTSGATSARRAG